MTKHYRDAATGFTTAEDAAARPGETVAEAAPARRESPDVAELRRRLAELPGFTLKHLHGGPGWESFIGLGDEGGMPLSDSGFDAVLLFAEIAALEVPRLLDRLAHMTEARDNARAEVERLAAMVEAVREACADLEHDCVAGYCDPHEVRPAIESIAAVLDEEPQP